MKISIITAVYNNEKMIGDAINSIVNQKYFDIEKVMLDGASTDGTLAILKHHAHHSDVLNSAPDDGIYDALNIGIDLSSGDVVGLLHSDDLFANESIVSKVADVFINNSNIDAVYGDLVYVDKREPEKIIRYWQAGPFHKENLKNGWMPPHPTLYLRRSVYEKIGKFNTEYRIAADYDFMLRVLTDESINVYYLPEVLVKMRVGGESNRSLKNIVYKSLEDYRVMKENGVGGLKTLLMKNFSKLPQFFKR